VTVIGDDQRHSRVSAPATLSSTRVSSRNTSRRPRLPSCPIAATMIPQMSDIAITASTLTGQDSTPFPPRRISDRSGYAGFPARPPTGVRAHVHARLTTLTPQKPVSSGTRASRPPTSRNVGGLPRHHVPASCRWCVAYCVIRGVPTPAAPQLANVVGEDGSLDISAVHDAVRVTESTLAWVVCMSHQKTHQCAERSQSGAMSGGTPHSIPQGRGGTNDPCWYYKSP
jgi:hypothetical protein